jgi:hypothetical protein
LKLSAVAAALGLFATLWSTMIGKTLPELLKSDEREVVKFRNRVDEACSAAAQNLVIDRGAVTITDPPITLLNSPTSPRIITLTPSRRKWARRTRFARRTTASFAALQPPAQLDPDYRDFVAGWKRLTLAMDHTSPTVRRVHVPPSRPLPGPGGKPFILDPILLPFIVPRKFVVRTPSIQRATDGIRAASIPLGLEQCAGAMRR